MVAKTTKIAFLEEKLGELSKRREEIETGIIKVDAMIQETEKDAINKEILMEALSKFSINTFDHLQPYQQKELIRLLIHKVIISEAAICEPGKKNSQASIWLPIVDNFRTFFLVPTEENTYRIQSVNNLYC